MSRDTKLVSKALGIQGDDGRPGTKDAPAWQNAGTGR